MACRRAWSRQGFICFADGGQLSNFCRRWELEPFESIDGTGVLSGEKLERKERQSSPPHECISQMTKLE